MLNTLIFKHISLGEIKVGQATVIDLFCGCGGLSWGLQQSGFKVLGGVDHCLPALNTFRLNHPQAVALQADMTMLNVEHALTAFQVRPGELDCLVGGPPCQGFSKNVPASARFLDDPRNQLFKNFLLFVERFRPKTVLMENVAEIYAAYQGIVREQIINGLNELGYSVRVAVLNAADYGVPQNRRRCFFFASNTGKKSEIPFPTFKNGVAGLFHQPFRSAWSAISDLPVLQNGEGYDDMPYPCPPENEYQALMRSGSSRVFDHATRKLNERQMSRVNALTAGQSIKDLPDALRPRSGYSGAYGRLDFESAAPTITRWVFHPGSGRYFHPRDNRLITIREAARLQSFSDKFHFTGTYIEKAHQIGNAVPPLLAAAFGEAILSCL